MYGFSCTGISLVRSSLSIKQANSLLNDLDSILEDIDPQGWGTKRHELKDEKMLALARNDCRMEGLACGVNVDHEPNTSGVLPMGPP